MQMVALVVVVASGVGHALWQCRGQRQQWIGNGSEDELAPPPLPLEDSRRNAVELACVDSMLPLVPCVSLVSRSRCTPWLVQLGY